MNINDVVTYSDLAEAGLQSTMLQGYNVFVTYHYEFHNSYKMVIEKIKNNRYLVKDIIKPNEKD